MSIHTSLEACWSVKAAFSKLVGSWSKQVVFYIRLHCGPEVQRGRELINEDVSGRPLVPKAFVVISPFLKAELMIIMRYIGFWSFPTELLGQSREAVCSPSRAQINIEVWSICSLLGNGTWLLSAKFLNPRLVTFMTHLLCNLLTHTTGKQAFAFCAFPAKGQDQIHA